MAREKPYSSFERRLTAATKQNRNERFLDAVTQHGRLRQSANTWTMQRLPCMKSEEKKPIKTVETLGTSANLFGGTSPNLYYTGTDLHPRYRLGAIAWTIPHSLKLGHRPLSQILAPKGSIRRSLIDVWQRRKGWTLSDPAKN